MIRLILFLRPARLPFILFTYTYGEKGKLGRQVAGAPAYTPAGLRCFISPLAEAGRIEQRPLAGEETRRAYG